ncbi:hypothetical protein P168DRAFT_303022 [Aspergillus campestris IBT 28561]|uniref:Uncharacterized protein n=1 Tax=Aspergillus campestris (strain IBT 28561) TaxID=1392248 RepID=A0A2I1DA46_ASPC2|nr:uncharacterized protein P168DRAFT_303022 [Aspergillus campestris IBT 28561]PKY06755.1 hypothetical protein P168DRAFT_303022 [Aspergillus campestris IBT 28561]
MTSPSTVSSPSFSLAQILEILPGVTVHRESYMRCLATTNPQSAPSGCSNIISQNPAIHFLRDTWDRLSYRVTMYDLMDMMAPTFLCEHHKHQANHLAVLWKNEFSRFYISSVLNASTALAGTVPPVQGYSSASTSPAPTVVVVPTIPATRNSTGSLMFPPSEWPWPAGMVKPRPLEGVCGICFLSFVGEEAKQARWNDEEPLNGNSAPGNPVNGHAGEPDKTEDDEENDEDSEGPEDEWDFEYDLFPLKGKYDVNLLVWCRGHCGTNFHRRCMDRWIEKFRGNADPTCPICRKEWVEWVE